MGIIITQTHTTYIKYQQNHIIYQRNGNYDDGKHDICVPIYKRWRVGAQRPHHTFIPHIKYNFSVISLIRVWFSADKKDTVMDYIMYEHTVLHFGWIETILCMIFEICVC